MNEKEVINACIVEVLKDIEKEIEDYNVLKEFRLNSDAYKLGVTKGLDLSAEIINRKIKEHGGVKHDKVGNGNQVAEK